MEDDVRGTHSRGPIGEGSGTPDDGYFEVRGGRGPGSGHVELAV